MFKARSRTTESEKVRQQIADNLNSDNRLLTPIIPSSFPRRNLVFFFRETVVIAGSTNFSSNKRSLRYQSSKTSRVFLKDVMELKHESITLSSLVRPQRRPEVATVQWFILQSKKSQRNCLCYWTLRCGKYTRRFIYGNSNKSSKRNGKQEFMLYLIGSTKNTEVMAKWRLPAPSTLNKS